MSDELNKDIDKNSDNKENKKEDNRVSIVEDKLPRRLITIPVMGKPLFPGLYAPFPIPPQHAEAVNKAIAENDGFLGLNLYISDNPPDRKTPSVDDIYKVGVVVKVFKKLNLPDGGLNLLINSIKRYKIIRFTTTDPVIRAAYYGKCR